MELSLRKYMRSSIEGSSYVVATATTGGLEIIKKINLILFLVAKATDS
jgi:hypothetical protein